MPWLDQRTLTATALFLTHMYIPAVNPYNVNPLPNISSATCSPQNYKPFTIHSYHLLSLYHTLPLQPHSLFLLTWTDSIAPDAVSHIISSNRLGETHDSSLSGTVDTPVRSSFHAGSHGRHIDDVPSYSLLLPESNGCLAGVEHALDVDIKAPVPVFRGGILNGPIKYKPSKIRTIRTHR